MRYHFFFSCSRIACITLIILFSSVKGTAQVRVNLKDFSFLPGKDMRSGANPLKLPYKTQGLSLSVGIAEMENFETVDDFLDNYKTFIKQSSRSNEGLNAGMVIKASDNDKTRNVLLGMVMNTDNDARILVTITFRKGEILSQNKAIQLFNSFKALDSEKEDNNKEENKPVVPKPDDGNHNQNNGNPTGNNVSIQQVVDAHNVYRKALGIPPLSWSNELADYARDWGTNLVKRDCAFEHRPNNKYGENIFSGWGKQWTMLDAVDSWGDEKKNFDHNSKTCTGGVCGHYTQMIWKKTTRVGCALVTCGNGSVIVVCNYAPAGNMGGEDPY